MTHPVPGYTPFHPEVYQFSDEFLEQELLDALQSGDRNKLLEMLEPQMHGVFTFKCFTLDFCKKLVEELDQLEAAGVVAKKPNSMNKEGENLP